MGPNKGSLRVPESEVRIVDTGPSRNVTNAPVLHAPQPESIPPTLVLVQLREVGQAGILEAGRLQEECLGGNLWTCQCQG